MDWIAQLAGRGSTVSSCTQAGIWMEGLEPRVLLSTGIDLTDPDLQAIIGEVEPPPLPPRPDQPHADENPDLPVVEVSALDALASEDGDTAVLQFTRTGPTDQPLTIMYSVEGTANTDFEEETFTFATGQSVGTVIVTAIDDELVEGTEFANVFLLADENYIIGDSHATTIVVLDNDYFEGMPIINVFATANQTNDPDQPGVFTFVRTGSADEALQIPFTVTGTAVSGEDYESIGGLVEMPSGMVVGNLLITPLIDRTQEIRDVVVTLDFAQTHAVGIYYQDTVQILPASMDIGDGDGDGDDDDDDNPGNPGGGDDDDDNPGNPGNDDDDDDNTGNPGGGNGDDDDNTGDPGDGDPNGPGGNDNDPDDPQNTTPLVSVVATQQTATEDGQAGIFTVTRTGGDLADPLTVFYSVQGTAVNGEDYEALPGMLVIPAGADSAQILVTPIDDSDPECTELVNLTLQSGSGYVVGGQSTSAVRILDNDHDGAEDLLIELNDEVRELRYVDGDGTQVRVRLTRGQGVLRVVGEGLISQQNGRVVTVEGENVRVYSIHLTQSSDRTTLRIHGRGGDDRVLISKIQADGDLRMVRAQNTDLLCEIWIDGSLRRLHLGSTAGQNTALIWIAGESQMVDIRMDQVRDLSIVSNSPIRRLMVNQWLATGDQINQVIAPWARTIQSRGDFSVQVHLMDSQAEESLRQLNVRGILDGGGVRAASSIRTVRAKAMDAAIITAGLSPATQGLPDDAAAFVNRDAQIRTVRTGRADTADFTDSIIAAWSINRITLREVAVSDGDPFGISAHEVRMASYEIDGERHRLRQRDMVGPIVDEHGNFQLRLVS